MVSATGIGSGLDVNTIVEQLMAHESRPLYALQNQKIGYEDQLSAFGQLKSALSKFQDALGALNTLDAFIKHTAISSDEAILTADLTVDATQGNHTLTVNTLATMHQLVSAGFSDSTTSINEGTLEGNLGTSAGTLEISLGETAFQLAFDTSNDSLLGIKNAINNADDNPGVNASIIVVDDGFGGNESRLVLSSELAGAANVITLEDLSGNTAARLSPTMLQAAADASFVVDGFTVTRTSNTVDDVLEGVSLTLKQTGGPISLAITRDIEAVKASVGDFVQTYNDLVGKLNQFSENDLSSDYTVKAMKLKFHAIFNSLVEAVGAYQLLSEVGITTTTTGAKASDTLSINDEQLTAALNSNFSAVANLFAASSVGIAPLLDSYVTDLLGDEGIVNIRETGIGSRLKNLDKQIERQQFRLEQVEARYLKEFSTLDAMLSQLQTTSLFLTQQLGQMQGINTG